jgi:hypothetical protein
MSKIIKFRKYILENEDDLIARADRFAAHAHRNQKRKYTFEPYVEHTREVAKILKDHGRPPEEIAAALLHDTVEDTDATHEDIVKNFGPKVAQYVHEVTDVSMARGNSAKLHMPDKREITVNKPARAKDDQLAWIDVDKFDKSFQQDKEAYVGPGGSGNAIGNRYHRFNEFLTKNDKIDTSEVHVNEQGKVSFINGRHRYAALRDAGVKHLPVSMSAEALANARKAKHPILSNREARKHMDHEHLKRASEGGQNIKMADLVSNTKSIVAHDPNFAKVYLKEKRSILSKIDKAHPKLKKLAMDHLVDGEKKLGINPNH